MVRKSLSLLLVLLMIILCPDASPPVVVPAQAQGPTLALVAPSGPQFATGSIEVQVVITGALSLGSFEFDLEYDPALVEIGGVLAQGFLGQEAGCDPYSDRCAVTLGPQNQSSAASTGAYTYGSGPGATGDGVLALLQLLPTGEGGTLLLDLTDALITDTDANPTVPSIQDATLTLEPAYPLYLPLISVGLPSAGQLSGPSQPAISPHHIDRGRSLSGGEPVVEEACLDFAYPAGVGAEDMEVAAAHWREQSSDPGWEGRFDLNGDETIDVVDIMHVSADWATMCLPYATTEVGPTGGTLQLGGFNVVIPPGLLSETIVITATEVPSQTAEVAEDLDPADFHPLEPGFELIAPIASDEPLTLTLSYETADIPVGFDPQNLGILLRTDPLMENPGGEPPEEIPEVVFCPLPASVDEGTRQVQMDIHTGGAYQLVAMAQPLEVVLGPAITDTQATSSEALANPQQTFPVNPFRIVWLDEPPGLDKVAFETQAFAGLNAAFNEFTLQRGFPAPVAQVTVEVKQINKPRTNAGVSRCNPLVIVADPYKTYNVQSTMAHEYFHVIQFWNSNKASKLGGGGDANRWFSEGTASWAQDVVFDTATDHYVSPTGERFTIPLNKSVGPEDNAAYETVAFFKWLESKAPGSILAIMLDHLGQTHSSIAPSRVRNSAKAMFLDSLKSLHLNLNFLMFAESALYWKDFDTNEKGSGDLWYPDRLGGAGDVPTYFRHPAQARITKLKKGGAGDGYAKRREIRYALARHLTADVQIIANSEGSEALSGMLHLQFAATTNPEVDVAIIARQSGASTVRRVTGLSVQQETITAFGEGSEVIVIPVAPDWDAPDAGPGQVYNLVSAWVEPCGGETKNVTDVYNRSEMYQAVAAASPGDTVRVAPGSYYLYAGLWDNIGSYASLVIDKEVTLAGWGPDQTTLYLYGEDGAIWLWLETARVTFRDIRIQSYGNFGFLASGATRVSFCNVFVEFYPARTQWGLQYNPFDAGGVLEVFGTTFSCADCDATAFDIAPYSAIEPAVDVYVRGSSISGWDSGIEYCTYDGCGQVNVDADCGNFSDNVDDIWRCDDSGCEDICDTVQ